MEQMREEFEEWAKPRHYDLTWGNILDNYNILSTRCVWDAWAASRAALVVELPVRKRYPEEVYLHDEGESLHYEYLSAVDDFKTKLDAAGVKYK